MPSVDPFRLIGTIVDGRYRVDSVAGQGGHGVVYRAFHLTFESAIALKVLRLPAELTPAERRTKITAFRREGKVLFELSALHASIVKAFETGVVTFHDGAIAPYLALEWLDGVSLDREVKYRRENHLSPLQLTEILTLLDPAAHALALAHARGVAHRDIKPGNLFATVQAGRRFVKVLDFGIAKILDDSRTATANLVQTGGARSSFTPMYGAPEQWLRRLGATGPWTDVHAWALVCVELLTGKAPFSGDEPALLMVACLDASFRPTPRSLGFDVSDEVEAVFARGLALDPRDRFRDVGAFWSALCQAARWSPAESKGEIELKSLAAVREASAVEGPLNTVQGGARTVTGTTLQHGTPPMSVRRSRVRWPAVAGACVLALGVIVVASLRDSPAAKPHETSNGRATASAIDGTREPLPSLAASTPSTLSVELTAEGPRWDPLPASSAFDRKMHKDRALPAPAPIASAGVARPAASAESPGSARALDSEVRSPDRGPAVTSPRPSAIPDPRKSPATLEQLMDNEELRDRR